jgi:hypothetical protein
VTSVEAVKTLPRGDRGTIYIYKQGIPIKIHSQDNLGLIAISLTLTGLHDNGFQLEDMSPLSETVNKFNTGARSME